jgi:secreted PhoX family phosphatase
MTLTRRDVLKGSALASLSVLTARLFEDRLDLVGEAGAAPLDGPREIGPLVADPAGILDLPEGFSYRIVTQAGRPLLGDPSTSVPGRPDGTASFRGRGRTVHLVNNHEQSAATEKDPVRAAPELTYDPGSTGGTTTIVVDRDGELLDEYVSLAGTSSNCAGGAMPWGTWLSCEETETKAGGAFTKDHGYVFEVHPFDNSANRNPTPLVALGRFAHEAVVADPRRGHLYLTEDASGPNGLLYRFTPKTLPNRLHSLRDGGTLEGMRIAGVTDLSVFDDIGTELDVTWTAVPDPSALVKGSVRKQFDHVDLTDRTAPKAVTGEGGAITRSRKFEGLWWANGRAWIVCSFARTGETGDWSAADHDGQVWSYDPVTSTLRLEVYFPQNGDPEGAGAEVPDGPDNITIDPWGGIVVAEDGHGTQHLVRISKDGDVRFLARNAVSDSEFTGVNFSPDGRTLFANIQDEGYVFAITGPFARVLA